MNVFEKILVSEISSKNRYRYISILKLVISILSISISKKNFIFSQQSGTFHHSFKTIENTLTGGGSKGGMGYMAHSMIGFYIFNNSSGKIPFLVHLSKSSQNWSVVKVLSISGSSASQKNRSQIQPTNLHWNDHFGYFGNFDV